VRGVRREEFLEVHLRHPRIDPQKSLNTAKFITLNRRENASENHSPSLFQEAQISKSAVFGLRPQNSHRTQCLQIRHATPNQRAQGMFSISCSSAQQHMTKSNPRSSAESTNSPRSSNLPACHPLKPQSLAGRRVTRYLSESGTGSDGLVGLASSTSDVAAAEASRTKSMAEQLAVLGGQLSGP